MPPSHSSNSAEHGQGFKDALELGEREPDSSRERWMKGLGAARSAWPGVVLGPGEAGSHLVKAEPHPFWKQILVIPLIFSFPKVQSEAWRG